MAKKAVRKIKETEVQKKNCWKSWNDRVKNLSYHDLKHMKLASIAFAFFLVSVWHGLGNWLMDIHWGWFLGLTIIFSIKPWTSFWQKKRE